MTKLLLLHGPNLSQLGTRDPEQYGTSTLEEVVAEARATAQELDATLEDFQTEHEGEFVERLHAARSDATDGLIVNAGAWTHYSYAIRDALELHTIPTVELHLSNVHAREGFRRTSVIAPACDGSIAGFGTLGYPLAVRAVIGLLAQR